MYTVQGELMIKRMQRRKIGAWHLIAIKPLAEGLCEGLVPV